MLHCASARACARSNDIIAGRTALNRTDPVCDGTCKCTPINGIVTDEQARMDSAQTRLSSDSCIRDTTQ